MEENDKETKHELNNLTYMLKLWFHLNLFLELMSWKSKIKILKLN